MRVAPILAVRSAVRPRPTSSSRAKASSAAMPAASSASVPGASRGRQHPPGVRLDVEVVAAGGRAVEERSPGPRAAPAGWRPAAPRVGRAAARGSAPATGRAAPRSSASSRSSAAYAGRPGRPDRRNRRPGSGAGTAARPSGAAPRPPPDRVGGLQRGRDLHLHHRQPGRPQPVQRLGRLLPGAGQVGQVEADAEPVGVHSGQQLRPPARCVSTTQPGSGSKPTRTARPVSRSHVGQAGGQLVEPPRRAASAAAGVPRLPPGQRQRGDRAAGGVVGQQVGQHPGQVERCRRSRCRRGPVRVVDGLLDHRGLEGRVREAVEGDHLQPARVQLGAQPTAQRRRRRPARRRPGRPATGRARAGRRRAPRVPAPRRCRVGRAMPARSSAGCTLVQ